MKEWLQTSFTPSDEITFNFFAVLWQWLQQVSKRPGRKEPGVTWPHEAEVLCHIAGFDPMGVAVPAGVPSPGIAAFAQEKRHCHVITVALEPPLHHHLYRHQANKPPFEPEVD